MDSHVLRYLVRSRAFALGAFALAITDVARAQAVVNAPVAPDAIYVGRIGTTPGISVVDLNGFGQSTGNPHFDPTYQTFVEGNSNFPNNPNVKLQGSLLIPPLAPGTSTLDGGSAGVFTLTRNSELRDILTTSPDLMSVGDMMLGAPLDLVYNDGPPPFGCQAGGGNLCLADGLHTVDVMWAFGSLTPTSPGGSSANVAIGAGNPISFAPHPNPPPLLSVPSCLSPFLSGQEPTSVLTPTSNLLGPGDPLGLPAQGVPPSGLLALRQNAFFTGGNPPQTTISACTPYQVRQQIGHFLYVVDRVAHQVVVLDSNRFTVITRITLDDPTELAMSPDLKYLAVTNRSFDKVSFIDIDPRSSNFHQLVTETNVGHLPSGIAWEPGNEDVLVCNEGSDSVSILSAQSLGVRKVVKRALHGPFAVVLTPRQRNFGSFTAVYYGYILDRAGKVSLFESGPNTVNGWGFDALIGQTSFTFANPKAMQADPTNLSSGVWIAHEGQLDASGHPTGLTGGAMTNLVLVNPFPGPHSTQLPVGMLGKSLEVLRSIGSDQLTGIPTDVAFDDQVNLGALADNSIQINSKNLVRDEPGALIARATNVPRFMFVSVSDAVTGMAKAVDVIVLASGLRQDVNAFHAGTQSIQARGASIVMDYFRQ